MLKDLCFEIIQTYPNNCLFCSSCAGMDKNKMIDFDVFKKTIDHFINIGVLKKFQYQAVNQCCIQIFMI